MNMGIARLVRDVSLRSSKGNCFENNVLEQNVMAAEIRKT
jgi:hypothetical protein